MNKKTCIISFFSKGREDYHSAIKRMIDSVLDFPLDVDLLIYSPDADFDEYRGVKINKGYPPGCSEHSEVPYQFKPYLFKLAREQGYEVIIWLDSTMQILRDPTKLIRYAETNGFTVSDNLGHLLKNYMSDDCMEQLGVKTLDGVPQIICGSIIFDVTKDHVNRILDEWIKISDDGISFQGKSGSTREGFVAHRHDQAVLSYLLWKNKVEFLPYGFSSYPPLHESGKYEVVFLNKNS